MQLSDFSTGMPVHSGGNTGTVTTVGRKYVHVLISGKVRKYLPAELTPPASPAVMPQTAPKRTWVPPQHLRTTRLYAPAVSAGPNARYRRLTRNGAERYRVSL